MYTDSLFFSTQTFVVYHLGLEFWNKLNNDEKVDYTLRISKIIQNYINERSYLETQRQDFLSQVDDFKIEFKQEVIAKAGIFVAKKKYSLYLINEEGVPCDKLHTKGLDVIQSSSPEAVKPKLKYILESILKGMQEKELNEIITKFREELVTVRPEEIALNIGANKVHTFLLKDGTAKKATPYHIKGCINYNKLIDELGLAGKYQKIQSDGKVKVIYVKKNPYAIETIAFYRWPKEFDEMFSIDFNTLIDKTFIKKIRMITEPIGMNGILNDESSNILNFLF